MQCFLHNENSMKKNIITFVLSFLSFYANADNPIEITDVENRTCNQYIADIAIEKNKDVYKLLYSTWVQEYLIGKNTELELLEYKVLNLDPTIELSSLLLKACIDTRDIGVGAVALSIVADALFKNTFEQKVK
jgi:hypothetical protein